MKFIVKRDAGEECGDFLLFESYPILSVKSAILESYRDVQALLFGFISIQSECRCIEVPLSYTFEGEQVT